MTEEIIIDGVNVAGCESAVKPINDNRIKCHCVKGLLQIAKMHEQPESVKSGLCENNPNCYYKQLKRLEQENKELKEIINKSARSFCNDYLKTFEENKFLNNQIMEVKFNAQQEIEFLTEENNNYRSALEEIGTYLNTLSSIDNDFPNTETYLRIQDTINEVLNP